VVAEQHGGKTVAGNLELACFAEPEAMDVANAKEREAGRRAEETLNAYQNALDAKNTRAAARLSDSYWNLAELEYRVAKDPTAAVAYYQQAFSFLEPLPEADQDPAGKAPGRIGNHRCHDHFSSTVERSRNLI
jgi:hypothetical protein